MDERLATVLGALLGGVIASVGLGGVVWWYLWRGVPGKKDCERIIREVYW